MKKRIPIDVDRCNELFEYRDGQLIWRVNKARAKKGDVAGCVHKKTGYSALKLDGKMILTARIIYAMHHGDPAEKDVDHINHLKSDNRIENLRLVTHQQNLRNQSKSKNNKSGTTGVFFCNTFNQWVAQIRVDGKIVTLGYFKKKRDAIFRRKLAEIAYGYHPNHGS